MQCSETFLQRVILLFSQVEKLAGFIASHLKALGRQTGECSRFGHVLWMVAESSPGQNTVVNHIKHDESWYMINLNK